MSSTTAASSDVIDSAAAWWRLAATLAMATLGGVGMWSVVVALPTVNVEQLLMAFNARIIDDAAFSAMLETSWGTPLGEHAVAAREEQRKAEYVLLFRDKKEPPKKKAK